MKVYQAVLDQLIGAGVTYFSGMIGSTAAPYAATLADRNDMRYVGVRHEHTAASILDATARLTGKPGCLMVHGASGFLAASAGIASAALDSTPMFILSATQERRAMESGWWQTMNVQTPLSDVLKWQKRVERPDQAIEAVRAALREAVTGSPGSHRSTCRLTCPPTTSDREKFWNRYRSIRRYTVHILTRHWS